MQTSHCASADACTRIDRKHKKRQKCFRKLKLKSLACMGEWGEIYKKKSGIGLTICSFFLGSKKKKNRLTGFSLLPARNTKYDTVTKPLVLSHLVKKSAKRGSHMVL